MEFEIPSPNRKYGVLGNTNKIIGKGDIKRREITVSALLEHAFKITFLNI